MGKNLTSNGRYRCKKCQIWESKKKDDLNKHMKKCKALGTGCESEMSSTFFESAMESEVLQNDSLMDQSEKMEDIKEQELEKIEEIQEQEQKKEKKEEKKEEEEIDPQEESLNMKISSIQPLQMRSLENRPKSVQRKSVLNPVVILKKPRGRPKTPSHNRLLGMQREQSVESMIGQPTPIEEIQLLMKNARQQKKNYTEASQKKEKLKGERLKLLISIREARIELNRLESLLETKNRQIRQFEMENWPCSFTVPDFPKSFGVDLDSIRVMLSVDSLRSVIPLTLKLSTDMDRSRQDPEFKDWCRIVDRPASIYIDPAQAFLFRSSLRKSGLIFDPVLNSTQKIATSQTWISTEKLVKYLKNLSIERVRFVAHDLKMENFSWLLSLVLPDQKNSLDFGTYGNCKDGSVNVFLDDANAEKYGLHHKFYSLFGFSNIGTLHGALYDSIPFKAYSSLVHYLKKRTKVHWTFTNESTTKSINSKLAKMYELVSHFNNDDFQYPIRYEITLPFQTYMKQLGLYQYNNPPAVQHSIMLVSENRLLALIAKLRCFVQLSIQKRHIINRLVQAVGYFNLHGGNGCVVEKQKLDEFALLQNMFGWTHYANASRIKPYLIEFKIDQQLQDQFHRFKNMVVCPILEMPEDDVPKKKKIKSKMVEIFEDVAKEMKTVTLSQSSKKLAVNLYRQYTYAKWKSQWEGQTIIQSTDAILLEKAYCDKAWEKLSQYMISKQTLAMNAVKKLDKKKVHSKYRTTEPIGLQEDDQAEKARQQEMMKIFEAKYARIELEEVQE